MKDFFVELYRDFKRDPNNIWIFLLRLFTILPVLLVRALGEILVKYSGKVCDFLHEKLPRRR